MYKQIYSILSIIVLLAVSTVAGAKVEVLDARTGVLKSYTSNADGVFLATRLAPGDVLEVMPPVGEFTLPSELTDKRLAAIVAGSGITPVLSMITTALSTDPTCRFTLIYGNRTSMSVMFLEELEALKDRFSDRFHLMHVLSREPQPVDLFTGRIDAADGHSHLAAAERPGLLVLETLKTRRTPMICKTPIGQGRPLNPRAGPLPAKRGVR